MANLGSSNPLAYGYTNQFAINASNGTTAALVKGNASGTLGVVINSLGSAQTYSVSLYDAPNVAAASASNLIQTITLAAAQVQTYNFPFLTGLVVQASGAVTGNIWIVYS